MIRQFNALKRTTFTLTDFCTSGEIEQLKQYLDSNGTPRDWVPLRIYGETGPREDADRHDDDYPIVLFADRVLNGDIVRPDNRDYETEGLASDLVFSSYRADNERF